MMYLIIFTVMCMGVCLHDSLVSVECWRGHQISWIKVIELWAAMKLLGIEAGSSVWAESCLNHWAISWVTLTWILKEIIGVKWVPQGKSYMSDVLVKGQEQSPRSISTHPVKKPGADTARRYPSTSQGERSHWKPTLIEPWSWTSSFRKRNWVHTVWIAKFSVCASSFKSD